MANAVPDVRKVAVVLDVLVQKTTRCLGHGATPKQTIKQISERALLKNHYEP